VASDQWNLAVISPPVQVSEAEVEGLLLLLLLLPPAASDFVEGVVDEASPARFFFLSLPDLKSVSYHPPPFSRKPAAETNLVNSRSPQDGHSLRGSSESR